MAHLPDFPVMGWKALWQKLQAIVDVVNTNEPVEGAGIRMEHRRGGGTLISLADQPKNTTQNQSGMTGGGGGGGPVGAFVQIQAIDPATKNIVTLTVFSDGNGFSTTENDWVDVNSVDPATCQAVPLTLLKKPT